MTFEYKVMKSGGKRQEGRHGSEGTKERKPWKRSKKIPKQFGMVEQKNHSKAMERRYAK